MAHSYSISAFHIVFGTKLRRPLISSDTQSTLWKYLAGIARNHRMTVFGIGGTDDHAHVLVSLPANVALADAVRDLKCNSSRWLRETNRNFAWQQGYGAFSVSVPQLDRVKRYIRNQLKHHRTLSFEDEFVGMLRAANIAFEPSEVFD